MKNVIEGFKSTIIKAVEKEFKKKGEVKPRGYLLTKNKEVAAINMSSSNHHEREFISQIIIPSLIIEHNGIMLGIVAEAWNTVINDDDNEKNKLYSEGIITASNDPERKEIVIISFESSDAFEVNTWDIKRYKKKPFLANKNIIDTGDDMGIDGRYTNFFSGDKILI